MTPSEFEKLVAAQFSSLGYDVRLTGGTGDWGVDFFATRGKEKVAVQVKMYRGSRPVNRRQIFELSGVAAYFDCNRAILATDGEVTPDAFQASIKLGIDIWTSTVRATLALPDEAPTRDDGSPTFEQLWKRRVMPLVGETIQLASGGTNRILSVDWGGLKRESSTGRRSGVPIEPFMWAYRRIREAGAVTRGEINEQFEGRYSSIVAAVLSQIPELVRDPASGRISFRSN